MCPYETVALAEELEIKTFRDNSTEPLGVKVRPKMNEAKSPKNSSEPTSGSCGYGSQIPTPEFNGKDQNINKMSSEKKNVSDPSRKKKDPNSFTQNLFDTEAMKILHGLRIKEGLLHWAPWFKQVEISEFSTETKHGLLPTSNHVNSGEDKAEESHSSDPDQSASPTVQSRNSTVEKPKPTAALLSQWLEAGSDTNAVCRPSQENPINTSTDSRPLHTPRATNEPDIMEHLNDDLTKTQLPKTFHKSSSANSATKTIANQNRPEKESSIQNLELKERAKDDFEKIASFLSGEAFTKAAVNPNVDPVECPQALRNFTLQNVSALVTMIKRIDPSLCDENRFIQSLGRTTPLLGLSNFLRGTATRQEINIAFGTQSIIYVLSTTDALLRSFKGPGNAASLEPTESVNLAEIVHTFHLLMEIDYHPRNIFPSLWISTGNLHPPVFVRSKTALLKTCRSTKMERPPYVDSFDSESHHTDFLGDSDAAHVIKIALAALSASIPQCDPETWSRVQRLRASGRVAPLAHGLQNEKGFMNPLLEVMDAFDDETALRLMVRIVRAISARQCVSEILKYQKLALKNDEIDVNHSESFIEILLQKLVGSATAMARVGNIEDEPRKSADTKGFHLAVIGEWLRSVILSEWDGKAEISKWGAVGGALEFMSYICQLHLSRQLYKHR